MIKRTRELDSGILVNMYSLRIEDYGMTLLFRVGYRRGKAGEALGPLSNGFSPVAAAPSRLLKSEVVNVSHSPQASNVL